MIIVLRKNIPNFKSFLIVQKHYNGFKNKLGVIIPFKDNKNEHFLYSMKCGVNDTIRLKNFMYGGNPKLKMLRKYGLFQKTGEIRLSSKDKGKLFLGYEKARKFVVKLKIKNTKEWDEYCKSGKKPTQIPNVPDSAYKNKGWKCYGDWLGCK
jgi:hypothetical protein